MGLVRTVAPAREPLDVTELTGDGGFLRFDADEEDDIVSSLITAGRERCETVAEISLITQTWQLTLCSWPCGRIFRLSRPPLQPNGSLLHDDVEIQYVDSAGTTQTLDPDLYLLDTSNPAAGIIYPVRGVAWPTVWAGPAAVTVTYVTGYGDDAADVPAEIRERIKNYVAYCFEHRTDRDEAFLDSLFLRFHCGSIA